MTSRTFHINNLINKYLAKLNVDKKSQYTIKNYKVTYNQFLNLVIDENDNLEIKENDFKKLTNNFLELISKQHLSNSTINAKRTHMRRIISYAYRQDLIERNFSGEIESVPIDKGKEQPVLSPEEIKEIDKLLIDDINRSNDFNMFLKVRNRFIFMIFLWTGARLSEVAKLRWKDIDLLNSNITFIRGKGNKSRSIPLLQDLQLQIYKYKELLNDFIKNGYDVDACYYVFKSYHKTYSSNEDEKHITSRNIYNILMDIFNRANVNSDITPHCLRHTFATYALSKGVSPPVLAKMLGHSNVQVTFTTYAHVISKEQMRNEVNKLNFSV